MAAPRRTITSRDNPLLVRLRKLVGDPSAYRKQGEVWLEGEHLCAAFAARGKAAGLALVGESSWERPAIRDLAGHASEIIVVPDRLMASVGTLGSAAPLGFLVSWSAKTGLRPHAATVVLDRLQDAGNVGMILRSAAAFGMAQVVALKGCAALWSPKVLRAGMGAHFGLDLVEGLGERDLDGWGVPMLATSSHAGTAIDEALLPWPCAWVLGHEGQGVSPTLAARCAATLRIPQPGGEESLNVGAAAAVCFYESARQRLRVAPAGLGPATGVHRSEG